MLPDFCLTNYTLLGIMESTLTKQVSATYAQQIYLHWSEQNMLTKQSTEKENCRKTMLQCDNARGCTLCPASRGVGPRLMTWSTKAALLSLKVVVFFGHDLLYQLYLSLFLPLSFFLSLFLFLSLQRLPLLEKKVLTCGLLVLTSWLKWQQLQ